LLPFPEGELGLPVAEPFPFPGKKAPPFGDREPEAPPLVADHGGEIGDLGEEL